MGNAELAPMGPTLSADSLSNPSPATGSSSSGERAILPQSGDGCGCGGQCSCSEKRSAEGLPKPPSFIYAIGSIHARFPNLGLEKEFAQATGRMDSRGIADRALLHELLARTENRYIARQMCFILTIEGLDTYLLAPQDSTDLELLIQSLREESNVFDLDVVIGRRGPIAPLQLCNGVMLPIVFVNQVYSFDRKRFIDSIPLPPSVPKGQAAQFRTVADDVLSRIMQLADNAGASDDHRALNYLAVRYSAMYAQSVRQNQAGSSLSYVETKPSRLSGPRRVVDVILSFTMRDTGVVEKVFVRVDVTDEFPFLVTPLQPYFDR